MGKGRLRGSAFSTRGCKWEGEGEEDDIEDGTEGGKGSQDKTKGRRAMGKERRERCG